MNKVAFYFKGYRCFKNSWAGFEDVKPVNIVIGRNNTGKSQLLELVRAMTGHTALSSLDCEFKYRIVLTEEFLRPIFHKSRMGYGNTLPDDPWLRHGSHYVDKSFEWEMVRGGGEGEYRIDQTDQSDLYLDQKNVIQSRKSEIYSQRPQGVPKISGRHFVHLAADRDIIREAYNNFFGINPNGTGATNTIRQYLLSANELYPREVILNDLLDALNEIFGEDGTFDEVVAQQHDGRGSESDWEIYLRQAGKGLIPLSRSGSGLKTIILVLLDLLVLPHLNKIDPKNMLFAFEELENNLHPAIQRRLLRYIERWASEKGSVFFITTHSSVALDYFGTSPEAQIVNVTHDGTSARTTPIDTYFERRAVIKDLGSKHSDLLQANGIVWVEGPSDRIYINKWIEIYSDGELKEGRDYQCAFYGGALLATVEFTDPDEADGKLLNLLSINAHVALVSDSDRTSDTGTGSKLKDRVARVLKELGKVPGACVWVMEAKEIENYVPSAACDAYFDAKGLIAPAKHEFMFRTTGAAGKSYVDEHNLKNIDKMDLARVAVDYMTRDTLKDRFDLPDKAKQLVDHIRSWNT